jgi:hypothetical protein
VEGRVGEIEVNDSEIVQTFVPARGHVPAALKPPRERGNYMFFRGGTLSFGKLTMRDADLLIMDAEPTDPFDFFLDHYAAQLVAGYSRATLDKGLIVTVPDYRKISQGKTAAAQR